MNMRDSLETGYRCAIQEIGVYAVVIWMNIILYIGCLHQKKMFTVKKYVDCGEIVWIVRKKG